MTEIAISKENLTKICISYPHLIFSFFHLFSKKPYAKDIFKLAVSRDPVTFLANMGSPYSTIYPFSYEEMEIFNEIALSEESIMN
ncbi:TPA: hypothetical protein DEG21_06015 [Patescibacteria group bacterium]|nr:hypothetical protein [Candidatus Gracilibacteria bacterium]